MSQEYTYTGLGDADTSDVIGGWDKKPRKTFDEFLEIQKAGHYEGNGIECYQAMIAAHGKEAFKTFCLLNIQKYSWRLGKKGDPKSDMQKIADYARLWLENA